ncbi:YncE family protein [Polaromonas jejuensis]|uniref:YncE family protein n=1 Tax=Polaromonas jejuensis TaxID=457502 RepID=A0ABW0Q914_9BURK|nr:hypothetical protein [Polaromonas jejuensis]
MKHGIFSTLVLALAVSACASGGAFAEPRQLAASPITGVSTGTNFSFDLGIVVGNRYYLSDKSNAAIDVFDTATSVQVGQIKGSGPNAFAGNVKTNGKADIPRSGPNGINAVGSLLYVGDVNSVKIIDPAAKKIIKTIVVGASGTRADEGCVDAVHGLYMISSPEADTPFATVINTATQAVVAQVTFTDSKGKPSGGLEQCRYDPGSDTFYVNNDGTTDNPHGELVAMPGASIRSITPGATVNYTTLAGMREFGLGDCDPTGLALGPNTDVAVGCRPETAGAPLLVLIMNRTTGNIVASVNAGGGDQIEYDVSTNRYYSAASRWNASGKANDHGACSAASPCTPVLAIIDAGTRTLVTQLPSGNNAHSVSVDAVTGKVFMPASSGVSPPGCSTCSNEPARLLTFAAK